MSAVAHPFSIGSRVIWDERYDGSGKVRDHWHGVVTAYRPYDYVIVKLDVGGTFRVPISDLRSAS